MTNATKFKLYSCAVKAKNAIDKACIAGGAAVTSVMAMGITANAEGAAAPTIDLSGVDFSGLTTSITSMVPQVLPVAVTVVGVRKAISFMMSTIRGC